MYNYIFFLIPECWCRNKLRVVAQLMLSIRDVVLWYNMVLGVVGISYGQGITDIVGVYEMLIFLYSY